MKRSFRYTLCKYRKLERNMASPTGIEPVTDP